MGRYNLIIKAGEKLPSLDPVAGDYDDWIANIAGWRKEEYRVVAPYLGAALPPLDEVQRVIITGAGAMVTDGAPWISSSSEWLAQATGYAIPILGICFGHQLLAHALGGQVDYNPRGVEVGTVTIHLTAEADQDPLFMRLPSKFRANVSHMQSVTRLPDGVRLLAYSDRERVHAFAWGKQVWGIQFHPEFDGEIVKHFIRFFDEQLKQKGRDSSDLLAAAEETPESLSLLRRFAHYPSSPESNH